MDRTYPWFDYDTWLSTKPDYCLHEDEDEVYERWKDEQVDDD